MKEISFKRKLLRQIKEYKNEVGYDNEQNYSKLYNMCVECDNEYGEPYLTDHIVESDLIDEDDVKYHMEHIGTDLDRMRCFIGDTTPDTIYRLDGYGNLDNATRADFLDLADELIEMLQENIKSLQESEL